VVVADDVVRARELAELIIPHATIAEPAVQEDDRWAVSRLLYVEAAIGHLYHQARGVRLVAPGRGFPLRVATACELDRQ
jgi:hypothetical protein